MLFLDLAIYNIKHNPLNISENIALKVLIFYFYEVLKCKQ